MCLLSTILLCFALLLVICKMKIRQNRMEQNIALFIGPYSHLPRSVALVRVMNKAIAISSCRNPCLHIFVPNDVMQPLKRVLEKGRRIRKNICTLVLFIQMSSSIQGPNLGLKKHSEGSVLPDILVSKSSIFPFCDCIFSFFCKDLQN